MADSEEFLAIARETTLTKEERQIYLQTLLLFDQIWRERLGHTYQLYGNTLLTAYRHSGFSDYNNGIDIIVSAQFNGSFAEYFASTNLIVKSWEGKSKVFIDNMNKTRVTPYEWRWPFLDVYFQKQTDDRLTDPINTAYNVSVPEIYPNILIPFEGHLFLAPRCVDSVLMKMFGRKYYSTLCTPSWNRKDESPMPYKCLPYELLNRHFPMNEWQRINEDEMVKIVRDGNSGAKPVKQVLFMPKCS